MARDDQIATTRVVTVNLHDTTIGIWQDDARDQSFEREVYGGLIRHLRDRGWTIGADPRIKQHYTILSPRHRIGKRGTLRCAIEHSGRVCSLMIWAETWPVDNTNGRRYDFDKLRRFDYLDRLRFVAERRHVLDWLRSRCTVAEVTDRTHSDDWPRFPTTTATEAVARRAKGDTAASLGRLSPRERTTKDSHPLADGDPVFLPDRKGRWRRGIARFDGGNTWLVIVGPYEIDRRGAWELWRRPPGDLRMKVNDRLRRETLERLLHRAMARLDLERAALFRRILFGDQPLFRVRKWKDGTYYAPSSRGYMPSIAGAGLYTRDEAAAEVRGCDELQMIGLDGQVVPA